MLGTSKSINGFDVRTIPGCALWLDASRDPTPAGSYVTTLPDRSGNGNDMVPTEANTMIMSKSGPLGQSVYNFSNTRATHPNFSWQTSFTQFVVVKNTGTWFVTGGPPGGYLNFVLSTNWDLIDIGGTFFATDSDSAVYHISIFNATPQGVTGWQLWCIGYTAGATVATNTLNGIVRGTSTGTAFSGLQASYPLWLNGRWDGSWDTSLVAEFIHFNSSLSTDQRQQVEGYLAWKWGLEQVAVIAQVPAIVPTAATGCLLWLDGADPTTILNGTSAAKSNTITTSTSATGGTITTSGGYVFHTFTNALWENFAKTSVTDFENRAVWNGWDWGDGAGISVVSTSSTVRSPTPFPANTPYTAYILATLKSPTLSIPAGRTMSLTFTFASSTNYVTASISVSYAGATLATYTSGLSAWQTVTLPFVTTTSTGNLVFTSSSFGLVTNIILSENFVPSVALTVTSLIVGGGGGGGTNAGGGGGAGGAVVTTSTLTASTSYSVVVGTGGLNGLGSTSGTNGVSSTFNGLTGIGGGGGGGIGVAGSAGGCGGGGGAGGAAAGASQQTNAFAAGNGNGSFGGGGGGGMGSAGANGTGGSGHNGGVGGNAKAYTIGGQTFNVAAGGGGGGYNPYGGVGAVGGSGGGGNGGTYANENGTDATSYGSGGGGSAAGGAGYVTGGKGYQGIVVIAYPITVTSWLDKSGNNNTATTGGTIETTTLASNGVSFNGNSYMLVAGLVNTLVNTPFVVFAVETVQGSGGRAIFGDGTNGGTNASLHIFYRNTTQIDMAFYANDLAYAISGTGTMRLWTFYLPTSTNKNIRLNGKLVATHDNSTRLTAFVTPRVASGCGDGNYYNGTISELIVFNVDLGIPAIQQMENYLLAKWNLVQAPPSRPLAVSSPLSVPGCGLWLDGADMSTLTFSGANITSWSDKSGKNNTATRPNGSSAITKTNLGLVFDGSGRMLVPGIAGTLVNTPFAIFIVETLAATSGYSIFFGDDVNGGTNAGLILGYRDTTNAVFSIYSNDLEDYAVAGTGSTRVWCFYLPTSSNRVLRRNGVVDVTHGNYDRLTRFLTPVLGRADGGSGYKGTISEIVVYPNDPGLPAIQRIEAYLMNKWQRNGSIANVPGNVPGMSLWLDGADPNGNGTDLVDGSAVSTWVDKSGSGNNGTISYGTVTYTALTQSMLFNSSWFQVPNGTISPGASTFTIFVVCRPTGLANYPYVYFAGTPGYDTATALIFYPDGQVENGFYTDFMGKAPAGTVLINETYLFSSAYNGTSRTLYMNGSPIVTGSPGGTKNVGTGSNYIGGGGGNPFIGTISEMIVFNRTLSDSDRQSVDSYLTSKWNVPRTSLSRGPVTSVPGCMLWLDGADPLGSGKAPATGTAISPWADKSGNGRNAINTTEGARPVYTAGAFNGLNTLVFSDDPMITSPASVVSPNNTISVFVVFQLTSGRAPSYNTDFLYIDASYGSFDLYLDTASNLILNVNDTARSIGPVVGKQVLVSIVSDGTTLTIFLNGTSVYSGAVGSASSTLNVSSRWQVGSAGYNGPLCEIVMYNAALNSGQRQSIEAYLSVKWGLTSLPYTPLLTTPTLLPGCQLWLDGADPQTIKYNQPSYAYFPFDGSTTDQSNAITLTTVGSVSYVTGKIGQAVYLANAANASGSNFSTNYLTASYTFPTTFTVAFWFNSTISTSAYHGSIIFMTNNNPSGYVANAIDVYFSGGNLGCAFNDIANNGTVYPVTSNTWYHAAITYNSGTLKLYVNGTQSGNTITGTGILNAGFMLGCGTDSSGPYPFAGYIDEFRIFTSVLTGDQIYNVYAVRNPVGAWLDKSGRGNTATSTGYPTPTYSAVSRAMTFDGSSSLTGRIQGSGTTLTLFFVATQTSSIGLYSGLICFGRDGYDDYNDVGSFVGAQANPAGTGINVVRSGNPLYASTGPPGTPFLCTAVFDGTNYYAYLNGVLAQSYSSTGTFAYTTYVVGGRAGNQTGSAYWKGYLGEAVLYNTSFTTPQRQSVERYLAKKWGIANTIYDGVPGQIPGCAMWFDAADSTTLTLSSGSLTQWKDKSGNGRNLSAVSGFANATVSASYQNALNVLNFSGNGLYRSPANTGIYPLDVYIVVAVKSLTAHSDVIGVGSTSSDSFNSLTFSEYTSRRWHNGSSYFNRTPNCVSPTDETSTGFLLIQWSIANNNFLLRRNGALLVQTASYTYTVPADFVFQIGFRLPNLAQANFSGYIGEIVVFDRQLETSQRQTVETYLANKWNLTTTRQVLPAIHPYTTLKPQARSVLPVDIPTCQLWLDAADIGSIRNGGSRVTDNGDTFTAWNDKSGNGRNMATTDGTFTYNNKAAVSTGSGYLKNEVPVDLTTFTAFFVATPVDGGDQTAMHVISTNGGSGYNFADSFAFYIDGVSSSRFYARGTGEDTYATNYIPQPYGGPKLFAFQSDARSLSSWINGTSIKGRTVDFQGNYRTGTAQGFSIGVDWGSKSYRTLRSPIHEVIIYNSVLETTQRQQIEGYLAKKWKISLSRPRVFTYTGDLQSWVCPPDMTSVTFHAWGAAGGCTQGGVVGGAGAYMTGTLAVTPGTTYYIVIGAGGYKANSGVYYISPTFYGGGAGGRYSGGGGGYSGIFRNSYIVQGYALVVVGGGGGGGPDGGGNVGGSATWTGTAQSGGTNSSATGGSGGTTSGGGAGGNGNGNGNGGQGYALEGGNGAHYGGGGGAGYWGGGGGGAYVTGGGGGSSYYNPTYVTGVSGENALSSSGLNYLPAPGYTSQYWQYPAGSSFFWFNGGNGLIVLVEDTKSHPYASIPPLIPLPFSPLNFAGCQVWNDASQLTSLTGTWPNLAGNSYSVECTGTLKPKGRNALNTVTFSTTQTWLVQTTISLVKYTMFWVGRQTGGQSRRVLQGEGYNQLYGYWGGGKRRLHPSYWLYYSEDASDSVWDMFSHSRTQNGPWTFNWIGASLGYGSASADLPLLGLAINAGQYPGEASDCEVGEIILYNSVLTPSQIAQVEGYLAQKWGFQMPVAHPYYSIPPARPTDSGAYKPYLYSRFYNLYSDPHINGPGWSGWGAQIGTPGAYNPVNFQDGDGRIGQSDYVGIITKGFMYSDKATVVTFRTVSDDGIVVYFNGNPVLQNWTYHGDTQNDSASVTLPAGYTPIELRFFEWGGGFTCELYWSVGSTGTYTADGTGVMFYTAASLLT
jgi:hypothetical protein